MLTQPRQSITSLDFPTTTTTTTTTAMPSQVATTPLPAPIPIPPPRRNLGFLTAQELFASLNATLASRSDELVTPVLRHIQEQDYSVPAPPPPSPVSFRDHWPSTMRS
ncbi:hypothetical protein VTH06DRAFT_6195 [Thermothelomyces fergusii]